VRTDRSGQMDWLASFNPVVHAIAIFVFSLYVNPGGGAAARAQSPACETDILQAYDKKTGDRFGWSTSVDGEWAFFGAYYADFGPDNVPTDTGSVYVFKRDGAVWTQHAELNASDAELYEDFGYSVSASGDFLLVGARKGDKGYAEKTGAAYIYRLVEDTWIEEQKIFATDAAFDDRFGYSVSLRGDWALVGAPQDDVTADDTGTIYFYHREILNNVATWLQRARKVASDRAEDDQFGTSVATTGDWAIAGAPNNDDACVPEKPTCKSGSAYVFKRTPGSTTWYEEIKLVGHDTGELDLFGNSVAIDGDVVVVGAKDHPGLGARTGAVYVFRYNGGDWVQEQKLMASDGAASDRFGHSVAIRGGDVVVGAYLADPPADGAGAAYWFQYDGETWVERAKLKASDGKAGDWFGYSVATDGNSVAVGAYKDTSSTGAGYVFAISPGEDCNLNGFPDRCDIADGIVEDLNGSGIPDECECTDDTHCYDSLPCTEGTCNVETSLCEYIVEDWSCVVADPNTGETDCVSHGMENPLSDCSECNSTLNPLGWSLMADGAVCADDGIECTKDECAAGVCLHAPEDEGTPCGDPVDTICDPLDTCNGFGVCRKVLACAGTDCTDGRYCTGDNDVCDGNGTCKGGDDPCLPLGLICNEYADRCECFADPACDDGNPCTLDRCTYRECENVLLPDCGACCRDDTSCIDWVADAECKGIWDTFYEGGNCDAVSCPASGACCFGGGCFEDLTEAFCEHLLRGVFAGSGTDCDACPYGACCIGTICVPGQKPANCVGAGGQWAGPVTECFYGICPLCDDGDVDASGTLDLQDLGWLQICFSGEGVDDCKCVDMDNDNDVDLDDFWHVQSSLTGP